MLNMAEKKEQESVRKKLIAKRTFRKDSEDFVFGCPKPLADHVLPTSLDVGRALLFIQKQKSSEEIGSKQVPLTEIIDELSSSIQNIWEKASIPSLNKNTSPDTSNLYGTKGGTC